MSDDVGAEPSSPQVPPPFGDVLGELVNRLFGRGRRQLGKAARAGRLRLELRQLQRDRDAFWARLGKTAYYLVDAGEIDHPALRKAKTRIDELEARIGAVQTRAADGG